MLAITVTYLALFCHFCLGYYDVIIIGAGASGIAAYAKLLENNVTDVLVLEAQNRIGGRINTVNFGDGLVDLGAEYVHGEVGNVVFEMANKTGMLGTSENEKLYMSTLPDLTERENYILAKISEELFTEDGDNQNAKPLQSFGDYYKPRFNYLTKKLLPNKDQDFRNQVLESMEKMVASTIGSNSWYDIAAKFNYRVTPGDLALRWNTGGYKTIFDLLLKENKETLGKNLQLNKEVTQIIWKNNVLNPGGVTIKTKDQSTYHANKVVVTTSLGVLKHTHESLFLPQLAMKKKLAISTMGFDAVGKIIVHFPSTWWDKQLDGAALVWNEDQSEVLRDFPYGPSFNGKSWLSHLFFVYRVPNNPRVLNIFLSGVDVKKIEDLPHEVVKEGVYYLFQKFFGRFYRVQKPDQVIVTQWANNPYFRGTYSYETISSLASNLGPLELQKPLHNEVQNTVCYFAGEATHPIYYSTVHGAIESGWREADRITNKSTLEDRIITRVLKKTLKIKRNSRFILSRKNL